MIIDSVFFLAYLFYFNLVIYFFLLNYVNNFRIIDYFKFENYLNIKTNCTMLMLFHIYQLIKFLW